MTIGITAPNGITLGLASRWTRLVGQMVDGFVAAIPLLAITILATFTGGIGGPYLIAATFAWMFFYLIFGDGLHQGQSFAKQWLGIRVVSADTGAPCTFGQSFLRNMLLAILGPIDWIFIFGDRHQRLGDKAAGTIVVVAD